MNVLSNNVYGFKTSKKGTKMFKYVRDKISDNGIIFLQETHSHGTFSCFFSLQNTKFMRFHAALPLKNHFDVCAGQNKYILKMKELHLKTSDFYDVEM